MLHTSPTSELSIAGQRVGHDFAPFVIAEVGVNHDGSVQRAYDLIDAAASAGAHAVKFQIFTAAELMSQASEFAGYQTATVAAATPTEMLRKFEFSVEGWQSVAAYTRARGLALIATPFSLSDVATLHLLGLDAVKIASPDVVNRPLLLAVAAMGKPMLISTGAATLAEVTNCHRWLSLAGAQHLFMHCVSSYPTSDADVNLCWIGELMRHFGGPVGYSDHSTDLLAGALAVAAGARVLEKHLTHDCRAAGPDHAASADPAMFAEYTAAVCRAALLVGKPGKHVLACEQDVRRVSRQSLITARAMLPGDVLTAADLRIQRPGTGIPAAELEATIGRSLKTHVAAGTPLTPDMLAA